MIAGKIIPAIATTTAMVTGLVSAELLKIALKKAGIVEKLDVRQGSGRREIVWRPDFGRAAVRFSSGRTCHLLRGKVPDFPHCEPGTFLPEVEHFKNAFVNLALPLWLFSEPMPPLKTVRVAQSMKCSGARCGQSVDVLLPFLKCSQTL